MSNRPKTILPTAYWPPVGYLYLLYSQSDTMLEACENYQKKSIRNKCTIITGNGVKTLSVPLVKGKHSKTKIREVKIAYHDDWQQKHLETLNAAYSNAPYYTYYIDSIQSLIGNEETYLYDLNTKILNWITQTFVNDKLGKIHLTQRFEAVNTHKFSSTAHYCQVYEDRHGFIRENVSILDLIFNVGYEIPLYFDNWSNFEQ